jgi:hypothetical protein
MLVLRGLIPDKQSSAVFDTLWNKVLWGIKPWGPAFKYEYIRKFKTVIKIFERVNSGTIQGRFMEKTGGKKSRATVPLMCIFLFHAPQAKAAEISLVQFSYVHLKHIA